ncbi:hypothetical protein JCM6882_007768 [Rhodosporidiobolus microsporus]
MADYQQAPLVPRSSKQAKMLGVGVDLESQGRPGPGGGAPPPPPGSGGVNERWDGWGVQSDSRGRGGPVEVIPPWGNGNDSAGRKKGSLMSSASSSSQPLRGARSASVLRGYGEGKETAHKEKKRGLFGGLLKRKGSRGDVRDGYNSDAASVHESAPPPPVSYETSQLPAKLQARGDAIDTNPRPAPAAAKPTKAPKKSKRPTTPASIAPSRNTPTTRHAAVFSADPEISLDMNLDSMEGIIAGAPTFKYGPDSISDDAAARTASISSGSLTRSSSSHAATNGRRPSMAPTSGSSESPARAAAPPPHAQASAVAFWSFGSSAADKAAKAASAAAAAKAPPPLPFNPPVAFPSTTSGLPAPGGGAPARPGMGSRTSSALSINTYNAIANGQAMRKPSVVGLGGAMPTPPLASKGAPALPPIAPGMPGGGAWTAPDSWAVKAEAGAGGGPPPRPPRPGPAGGGEGPPPRGGGARGIRPGWLGELAGGGGAAGGGPAGGQYQAIGRGAKCSR